MRGIEQRAIGTVVDVEFVAAALLDADQHARIFGAQRAAGLAPQLRRIGDGQALEGVVDDLEIGLERRRLHAGIGGRKAAADIDDVDGDRRLDDRRADPLHRLGIGGRGHRLAADMEADAERVRGLAGRHQQRLHLGGLGAELRGEAQLRMIGGDADPHQQVEIGRRTPSVARDDLLQLLLGVEREGADIVVEIGVLRSPPPPSPDA